jgi:enamine deaminase RidA (YjgF/YER057c/UK114 family)
MVGLANREGSAVGRSLVSSGSPFEGTIGFSRAVRVGNIIAVSGTAPIAADGSVATPGDVYGQTRRCLEITQRAIETAGGTLDHVVRTRIMLTDISKWEDAARAHGEFFGTVRPACTFVEVSGLIKKEWLVETEADCVVDEG